MLPLAGYFERLTRACLRSLPLSEYQKTRLWATSIPSPQGRVHDWAYYRCVELATRAFARPEGYEIAFPGAGNRATKFSMLEFGVANGQSLRIMLYFRDVWLRRFGLTNEVIVAGFDTFEGIPAPREGDAGLDWREGDFSDSSAEKLQSDLSKKFANFRLVKGKFTDTLPANRQFLRDHLPVFVSIDCDYYSSTMDVFSELLPDVAPHGCLFYFDDVSVDFYSDRTGELRAIKEVNEGRFGSEIQLVEYPLWIETREIRHYKKIYRLFNLKTADLLAQSRSDRFKQVPAGRLRMSPL